MLSREEKQEFRNLFMDDKLRMALLGSKAQDKVFKPRFGKEVTEEPMKYDAAFTREVFKDILTGSISEEDKEVAGMLQAVSFDLVSLDLAVRRIRDDLLDMRPLTDFPYALADDIIHDLSDAREGFLRADDSEKVLRYTSWIERALYVKYYAMYLAFRDRWEQDDLAAKTKIFDVDEDFNDIPETERHMLDGFTDRDEDIVDFLYKLELILYRALLTSCPWSDEADTILERIGLLDGVIRGVMNGHTDDAIRCAKSVQSAEEFAEADDEGGLS